jgi:hypothetical protein
MKRSLYATAAVFALPVLVSCGGSSLTLTVLPSATTLDFDTYGSGSSNFPYVQPQPRLNNGTTPSGMQGTSSAARDRINKTGQVNCNITYAGAIKSTVTASVHGVSGSATVTCDDHTSVSATRPDPRNTQD